MSSDIGQQGSSEYGIVWVYDPLCFSYLREGLVATTHWRGKPALAAKDTALLVGYAEVQPLPAPGRRCYLRRVWWLKKHDRDLQPNGLYRDLLPAEAVEPGSIAANRTSRRAERAGQDEVKDAETLYSL